MSTIEPDGAKDMMDPALLSLGFRRPRFQRLRGRSLNAIEDRLGDALLGKLDMDEDRKSVELW